MNLTHWANGVWTDATWVPDSWGNSPAPPRPKNPIAELEIGDGYIRRGRLVRWIKRPKELEPARAETAAVKKVAKRLRITRQTAQQIVTAVQRELAPDLNFLRASSLATNGIPDTEYSAEDIALMRSYWKAVVRYAEEADDEEAIAVLLI